jgi:hypothetical protein
LGSVWPSRGEKNLGKFREGDTNREDARKGAPAISHQAAIAHQTDEQLELYALGRLPEPRQAVIEEHLLICESCRNRLDEAEAFAKAMRQAIADADPTE